MNEVNSDNRLGEQILASIKKGELKMRSRWYFVLRDVIGGTAIVITLLIAVYLASFIIFVLHETGAWFVPVFGLAGWWSLFNALPWVLISLTTIFTILLAVLVRRFSSGYQWPLLYSVLAIGFLISAAAFIGVRTSPIQTFFTSPAAENVPFLGEYYPGIGILAPNDIHRGRITQVLPSGFILSASGSALPVFVASSTAFPYGTSIRLGDSVVVFGPVSASGTIHAFGIERVSN